MKYFLNADKTYREADLIEWAEQLQNMDRHVGNNMIEGHHVSTVWLGLEHGFMGGEPLVFETMIFSEHEPRTHIYLDRYSSWDKAVQGHEEAIEWVRKHCYEERKNNSYIGDGVYVQWDGIGFWLRTGDHRDDKCDNKIYMEVAVLDRLFDFVDLHLKTQG
jgi:hypothetical protein